MARYFFQKNQRIRSQSDFRRVMRERLSVRRGMMQLFMAPNDVRRPRFGVSVSRKGGIKAIVRNRLKRLGREAFRLSQHQIPADFDYVLIFTPKMSKKGEGKDPLKLPTFEEVRKTFLDMVYTLSSRRTTLPNDGA